jgi:hypothetical protein
MYLRKTNANKIFVISLIILLSFTAFLSLVDIGVQAGTITGSFGYTGAGASNDWLNAGNPEGSLYQYTGITGANLTTVSEWMGQATSGHHFAMAVYNWTTNTGPIYLLANSTVLTSTSIGYNTFTFPTGLSLVNGNNYWLVEWQDYTYSTHGYNYTSGSTYQGLYVSLAYSANWNTSLTGYNTRAREICQYANWTLSDTSPPTYSGLTVNSTFAGSVANFSATVNDAQLPTNGQYQFATNNTGSWVWDAPVNFTTTPQTVSVAKTLTSSNNAIVGYQWNFTDSFGQLVNTGIQTLTTASPQLITRVQGPFEGNSTTTPFNVTMGVSPTNGNMIILTFGSDSTTAYPSISSVTQTGVTWTQQKLSQVKGSYYEDSEIWAGVVGANAVTNISITMASVAGTSASAIANEYSGILPIGFLDQTSNSTGNLQNILTGTTATTTQNVELWVGTILTDNAAQSAPINGFTMMGGAVYSSHATVSFLENIVSVEGTANSGTHLGGISVYDGCIATFKAALTTSVTFTSNPTGTGFITVNGTAQTSPFTIASANLGDSYLIAANSPANLVAGQSQSLFVSWSDAGAQSHTYNVVFGGGTVTATFQPQFCLTPTVANSTISPSVATWVNSGGFQDFTYSPTQSYYNVTSVLIDGSPTTIGTHYNFTAISTYHSISVTSADITAPTVSALSSSSNYVGTNSILTSYWNDLSGLSGFIFGSNNTGVWVNSTWTAFVSTPQWANQTLTLNNTAYNTVGWEIWSNDTSGNWGNSGLQIFTLINNYQVSLTRGGTNNFIVGDSLSGTIAVLKDGVAYFNYVLDVTANGAAYTQNSTSQTFYDVQYQPTTVTYSIVNLIDLGTNQTVSVYTVSGLSVTWAPKPLPLGGSGSQDTTSPTPNTTQPNDGVAFQISDVNLGNCKANSTVTVTFKVSYSGSSYTITPNDITLGAPFDGWLNSVQIEPLMLQTGSAVSDAQISLTFRIPENISGNFKGPLSVTGTDVFGTQHTANSDISASVDVPFNLTTWIKSNPLVLVGIVAAVIVALGLIAVFSKRR